MSKSSRREADTLFGAWCAIQSFLAAIFFLWGAVCFSDGRPTGEEGLEGWLHAFHIPFRTVFATAAVNGENSTPLSQPYDISYHSWKSARQPAGVLWVFHYLCYIVCCTFSSANVAASWHRHCEMLSSTSQALYRWVLVWNNLQAFPYFSAWEVCCELSLLKTPLASVFILKAQKMSGQGNLTKFSEDDDP